MKNRSVILTAFLILGLFIAFSSIQTVQAQISNPATGQFGQYSTDTTSGTQFVSYFVNIWRGITMIGALAVILFMVWGAVEWITAGGDSGKIQKARDKMTQSIIGLILLVSSFVIIGFVGQLFFGDNFDILNPAVPGVTTPGGTYGTQPWASLAPQQGINANP